MQTRRGRSLATMAAGCLLLTVASTGCQVEVGGQTLPSAYYLQDDVQYYQMGPEFKLAREAAAMRAYQAEQALGDEP